MTSGAKANGRFGKQDFVYLPAEDAYRCPAGEKLTYHYTNEEGGKVLRRYWTTACTTCPLKPKCTTGPQRRITRWEHENVLEAVQQRLDANPQAMRMRRESVEHPFGTLKMRMGATHFLMKRLPNVATEMALHVLGHQQKYLPRALLVRFPLERTLPLRVPPPQEGRLWRPSKAAGRFRKIKRAPASRMAATRLAVYDASANVRDFSEQRTVSCRAGRTAHRPSRSALA
jgi:hypothetical protein